MEKMDAVRTEQWPRCPAASEYCLALFRAFVAHNASAAVLTDRLLDGAGVRLADLIDHWVLPGATSLADDLASIGMVLRESADGDAHWIHPTARLPRIRVDIDAEKSRMVVGVEDIRAFADSNDLQVRGQFGDPDSGYEEARYPLESGELAILARRGYGGFRPGRITASEERALARVRRALADRARSGGELHAADETASLLRSLAEDVETDRLVDEFFAAERYYYMERNSAAMWQFDRQQRLGIGWANHDHHTYRSSRAGFRSLINLWQELGFECREKFYAGAEGGWGAQILEHPVSRVVLFCDVDMAPEEINIDYSAIELPPLQGAGTIGLWCELHSESIGCAGLHHLEAEYDFSAVREQLERGGVGVMPPFTDLPMLKQAFTEAEYWTVEPSRAALLVERGVITESQRDQFLVEGARGSHLEILQRWEGFKGFNKTGVDAIVRDTDARARA